MTSLPDKIVAIHLALDEAKIPHAFGGALALAWCTQRARGTIDIDLNVFASTDRARRVFDALPKGVEWSSADLDAVSREGQVRLWWGTTPVDVFMNTTPFHEQVARRSRWEELAGIEMPFLSCSDLAVFKAFFNRTRDWADLEEMQSAGTLDVDRVIGVLAHYLGVEDERITRLRGIG